MTLRMFEDTAESVELPHKPLSPRACLVVELAIVRAWQWMLESPQPGFDLTTAQENGITHQLHETLFDVVFKKELVDGFNKDVFTVGTRGAELRNFDGSKRDLKPDLLVGFVHRPSVVIAYIRDSRAWKAIGHSPLGALSVLAMLVVLKLQVATGLLNADDDGLTEGPLSSRVSEATVDFAHEAHDWLFKLLLTLIALHLAAILFYHVVKKDNLVGPMVTGKGKVDPAAEPMRPGKWWVALLCLVAAIATTRALIALGG